MSSSEKISPKNLLQIPLWRILKLIRQSSSGWTALHLILIVVRGVLPLVQLYLIKLIIDEVTAGIGSQDKTAAIGKVVVVIIIAGIVYLIGAMLDSAASYVKQAHTMAVTDHLHDLIHRKSIEVDLAYYEDSKYFDNLHRAQQEAYFRPQYLMNSLQEIFQSGITMIAISGLLFSLHWLVVLILFIAVVPGLVVRLKYSGETYRWQRERTQTERLARYFSWMLTVYNYAKEIRLFELGKQFVDRYNGLRVTLRGERLQIARRRSISEMITQGAGALALFGSYTFIAIRAVQGMITLGDLVMYFQAFQRGLSSIRNVLGGLAGLYENNLFLSNLYEFLDLEAKVTERLDAKPVPRPLQAGIVVNNVCFRYPGSEKKALDDVNLTLGKGEIIALVGENGSGKTTLIKLLCRLYDPTEGAIYLDGEELGHYRISDLRREISVLFQDYSHYQLTARENIWFGNTRVPSEPESIAKAAEQAGVDDTLRQLPKGYETILGKWFEGGVELSIGEWQKVALARAFLRDSQIIVLDEPTSSMDAKTEFEVFEGFRRILRDRSAIIISHRFSTVRNADRIYVFDKGGIVESGTHDELIQLEGRYATMYTFQAQCYE
ncbi:MAG TPA: ABC transporter ATP-binding protein [Bacteroidetes bacterium]|nr:ABC transporter ATP-binding protein [Bacteroidota bacterium]